MSKKPGHVQSLFEGATQPLLDWSGVAIFTARGRWSVAVDSKGQPTKDKAWTIEAHKNFPFDVDIVLRFEQPRSVSWQGGRTLKMQVPADKVLPLPDFSFESLLFDKLGLASAAPRSIVRPQDSTPVEEVKPVVLEILGREGARQLWDDWNLPEGKGAYLTTDRFEEVVAEARVRASSGTPSDGAEEL